MPAHYIKQKTERIRLVPGDPERLRIVREVYERHLRDGWGYFRIAEELNSRGTPSPRGGKWSTLPCRPCLFNYGLSRIGTRKPRHERHLLRPWCGGSSPGSNRVEGFGGGQTRTPRASKTEWFERPEPALDWISSTRH